MRRYDDRDSTTTIPPGISNHIGVLSRHSPSARRACLTSCCQFYTSNREVQVAINSVSNRRHHDVHDSGNRE
jgi:hypothetical protein